MRKKIFYGLICAFIIQLLVPAYMIAYSVTSERNLEKLGTEYFLEVDPTLAEDGKIYFTAYSEEKLRIDSFGFGENKVRYALIDSLPNGLAYLHDITEKVPPCDNYIESSELTRWTLPKNFYETDNDTVRAMSGFIRENRYICWDFIRSEDGIHRQYEDTITVSVKVYKGNILIKGMYINGTPIEEYFKES